MKTNNKLVVDFKEIIRLGEEVAALSNSNTLDDNAKQVLGLIAQYLTLKDSCTNI